MSIVSTFEYPKAWIRLTSAQMGRNRRDMYGDPDTVRDSRTRARRNYNNYRRPPNWGLVISIILLVILLGGYGYLFFHLQPYTSFTANNEVAQVTVLQSRQGLHELSVQVTRFDANGYQRSDPHPYLIEGDRVELKYEYVTLPEWLGFIGLHSGYILTGLQGYYANGTVGTYQPLGTIDQDQSPLVSPQFKSMTFTPDGKAHPLIMSQTGLHEP